MYVCMYVCLSVTGLRLKYTGLCIVYVPLARAAQDAIARWRRDRGRGLRRKKTTTSLAGQTLLGGESLVKFPSGFCIAYSAAGQLMK